jgi:hypothetical protein
VRTYVAIAITVIWAITYIGSLITNNYVGFETATPVMLIAASFLMAAGIHRKNGDSHE